MGVGEGHMGRAKLLVGVDIRDEMPHGEQGIGVARQDAFRVALHPVVVDPHLEEPVVMGADVSPIGAPALYGHLAPAARQLVYSP